MQKIGILLVIMFSVHCFGQVKQDSIKENQELIFSNPEMMPIYKDGGDIGLKKFIAKNLKYPKTGDCISGRVYLSFMVDALGKVKNVQVLRGISPEANDEAIRVVKMLTFIPGSVYGKPVETKMTLPVSFSIGSINGN